MLLVQVTFQIDKWWRLLGNTKISILKMKVIASYSLFFNVFNLLIKTVRKAVCFIQFNGMYELYLET
jgi:hypothetical protein